MNSASSPAYKVNRHCFDWKTETAPCLRDWMLGKRHALPNVQKPMLRVDILHLNAEHIFPPDRHEAEERKKPPVSDLLEVWNVRDYIIQFFGG